MLKIIVLALGLSMTNFLFPEQPIKAILFDCDGTLVDSEEAHLAAWEHTLQNRNHELTPEQSLLYTGKAATLIAKLIAEKVGRLEESGLILEEKTAYYRELQEKGLPPIEGTVDFVKRLAQEKKRFNLKLGVASAAPKSEILSNLRHLGIEDLFDVVLSGQEDLKDYIDPEGVNKPKPYIYQHAAKLLNVAPSECVVIEDSATGITSGKAAGCITIAIPNRFTADQDLSVANLQLDTLSEVSIEQFLHMVNEKNK
ncbi:MAG TPA: HAD family phosphatase [Chlamydiales bacterium]|nr:HAD family phosphatase [Chlamydiales bacterium]